MLQGMKLIPVDRRMSYLFVCRCGRLPSASLLFQNAICLFSMCKWLVYFAVQTVQLVDERVPLPLTTSSVAEMTVLRGILAFHTEAVVLISVLVKVSWKDVHERAEKWRRKHVFSVYFTVWPCWCSCVHDCVGIFGRVLQVRVILEEKFGLLCFVFCFSFWSMKAKFPFFIDRLILFMEHQIEKKDKNPKEACLSENSCFQHDPKMLEVKVKQKTFNITSKYILL